MKKSNRVILKMKQNFFFSCVIITLLTSNSIDARIILKSENLIDKDNTFVVKRKINFLKSRKNNLPKIVLRLNNGTRTKKSEIYYLEGATTGFDNGYDSSVFNDASEPFGFCTKLVDGSLDMDLAIQSLPKDNYENMIIPLKLKAKQGEVLTFTAFNENLPSDIHVYLEDRQSNTFTDLSKEASTYTLSNDIDGMGQFYIHTSSKSLYTSTISKLNRIGIFKIKKTALNITGIIAEKAKITLFTLGGKKVFSSSFIGTKADVIQLPSLTTGAYVVRLQTEKGNVSKKIIVE